MARKQSEADQIRRIESVCCPVHGVCMGQHSLSIEGVSFSLAKCSRQDCDIMAIVDHDPQLGMSVRQIISAEQVNALGTMWYAMFKEFCSKASKVIDAELEKMARAPEVQLPIHIES